MEFPAVVSAAEWQAEHEQLLTKEKGALDGLGAEW